MKRQISFLLVAVLFGIAFGAAAALRFAGTEPSDDLSHVNGPQSPSEQIIVSNPSELGPDQLAQMLESLTRTLNEEIDERRTLSQQLEQLQAEVEEIQANRRVGVEGASSERVVSLQAIEDRFTEMGFMWQDRESIRHLEAVTRVRAVELNDLARREGWINSPRFSEEMEALSTFDNPIRDELGDDGYDRYLFAKGRPNRVVVGSVMETSQAQNAGFKPGDVIERYDGERVYSNLHLVRLRSSGELGTPIIVEITRDGQPMQITIPRGPMGMGAGAEQVDPRANGGR